MGKLPEKWGIPEAVQTSVIGAEYWGFKREDKPMSFYDKIAEAFKAGAEKEWELLNSDGFWDNFLVTCNGIHYRVAAHRAKDPVTEGHFEYVGKDTTMVPEQAEVIGINAAHSLNSYRETKWEPGTPSRILSL